MQNSNDLCSHVPTDLNSLAKFFRGSFAFNRHLFLNSFAGYHGNNLKGLSKEPKTLKNEHIDEGQNVVRYRKLKKR